eukprot:Colp12_sorted_trinity150504_noHs@6660
MVTASASQMEPLDARQVRNQAGGFVYKTSQLQRLRRFFCLGVEGGTYYATEKELSIENTTSIIQLIRSNGEAVVAEAKKFSVEGRVAKEKAIIFTLALCARLGDEKTKKAAYSALNDICRIPTSLFMFVGFCEAVSTAGTGWGRAHRRAVANWYNSKTPMDLAMHITKYQNREGWTHLDLLRLSHTAPTSPAHALIFRNVEPTNKRFCLALDVSGSMSCGKVCGSTSLTPRDACAAMALVTAATEPNHKFVGFSHRLVPVRITPDMRLDAVVQTMQMIPMGGTDCSLPILEALKRKKEFDTFIIYTDNETYYGSVHPSEALRQYRAAVNPHAQLIVVAFAVTGFTIADPADKGMMDMAGFDAAAPEVMRQFVLGEI